MISLTGSRSRFFFSVDGFEVLGFSGWEGISELFQFEIELVSRSRSVAFDSLVGKPAALTIAGPKGERYVSGIVHRFELTQVLPQRTHYRVHLAPPHFRLGLGKRLRIFQDKTTKEIVTQVLQEAGIGPLDWKLQETYQPRNFCVQYRESDLAFVLRLLEEEGIAFHLEHGKSELKTVFSDYPGAFQPIPGAMAVAYNESTSMVPDQEFVHAFGFRQQLHVGKVQLRDFNFRKPRLTLEAISTGEDSSLELYDYPGEFVEEGLGKRLAKVRLQQLESERAVGEGQSSCSRLLPGREFTLGGGQDGERHPRSDLNQDYLLVRVSHAGSQPKALGEEGGQAETSYANSFTVVPATVPFKPPRVTPRPLALGAHTAKVVGPKKEEIYVDEFGRVKVSFPWDRESKEDEKSSCWIRVAQTWAGTGFGTLFIPRVGQEVLVSFLEGDPDRPVIIGRVYNGQQTVPYDDVLAQKTKSIIRTCSSPGAKGSNEIEFEDKADAEKLSIHAQKDYAIVVENDRTSVIKHDRKEEVQNDQQVAVTNKSTHTAKEIEIEATTKLTLKVGGSTIVLTATGIEVSGTNTTSTASAIATIKGALVKIN